MRLNLGAGDDRRDGYLGVDCRLAAATDILADIRGLPFKDESAEVVLALDIMEHLQRYELKVVFAELFRITKSGGELYIKTPNLDSLVHAYIKQEIPFEEFERKVYGDQTYAAESCPENTHKTGFNSDMIVRRLKEAGFNDIEIQEIGPNYDWSNMIIKAIKT